MHDMYLDSCHLNCHLSMTRVIHLSCNAVMSLVMMTMMIAAVLVDTVGIVVDAAAAAAVVVVVHMHCRVLPVEEGRG